MHAPSSPHPTDRDLAAYGMGKLDDAPAEAIHGHLEVCPRVPGAGRGDDGRQLPRPGP